MNADTRLYSFDLAAFDREGYMLLGSLLDIRETERLRRFLELNIERVAGRGGVRNLLDIPEMQALAAHPAVRAVVESVLGPGARPVRGILFDKNGDANWKVPWHQDVTIAVEKRVDADGYGAWSVKDGVTHVQPPASVLERMVTLRLHIDDCPESNGALKVVRGSHRQGKIPERHIAEIVAKGSVAVCETTAGGALVMRPLLVHSSAAVVNPGHRRVLHFDFAVGELVEGMRWSVDDR